MTVQYRFTWTMLFLTFFRIHFELGISRLTGADEKVIQMESELQLLQPQVVEKAEVLYTVSVISVISSCLCLQ